MRGLEFLIPQGESRYPLTDAFQQIVNQTVANPFAADSADFLSSEMKTRKLNVLELFPS